MSSCGTEKKTESENIGLEIIEPEALQIFDPSQKLETIASGFKWTEGPLWIENGRYLLFSDIPQNKIFKWSEGSDTVTYLFPSGFTGQNYVGREPGSNALILDKNGDLVLMQHGDRRVAKMKAPLANPTADFITLADNYNGKKLNSPNDAVFAKNGTLYFTDPPYGLDMLLEDKTKELPFQGVFKLNIDGTLELLTDKIKYPNGLAITEDQKTLYVANSDTDNKNWYKISLNEKGNLIDMEVFFETPQHNGSDNGSPDGMKIHSKGFLILTGPEGIWVVNNDRKLIARIKTGKKTSNCAFDTDEKYLYLTCNDVVMRLKMKSE
jgi:gluconolactonase